MVSKSNKNVCWRCKVEKDATWSFCPHCSARLIDTRTPSPPNPDLDVAFLYDIYSFGWYNHHVSAVALYQVAATITQFYNSQPHESFRIVIEPPAAQCILRAKIFAEYVALFEAFGVLCIAISKRRKQSVMWTYLNTEPQDVAQFYDSIRDTVRSTSTQSLQNLLKLPSESQVRKALTSGFKKSLAGLPDEKVQLNTEDFIYDYEHHSQNLVNIAKTYRESENVRIYNKIKHVFPMVNGMNWLNPPLDPQYVAFAIDDKGVLARLPMQSGEVEKEVEQIQIVVETGLELMALYLSLYRLGLL